MFIQLSKYLNTFSLIRWHHLKWLTRFLGIRVLIMQSWQTPHDTCDIAQCTCFFVFVSGPVFCLLLGARSGCVRSITGQVTSVTWPVIGWTQSELTPRKRQKTGPDLYSPLTYLHEWSRYAYSASRTLEYPCLVVTGNTSVNNLTAI